MSDFARYPDQANRLSYANRLLSPNVMVNLSGLTQQTIAFAAAVQSAGGSLDASQQRIIDQRLVRPLLSANLWSSMVVLYPFIGGSAAAHSVNLINPGSDGITWTGSLTHNALGVTCDGVTGYGTSILWNRLLRDNIHLMSYAGTTGSPTAGGNFVYLANNNADVRCYIIHAGSSNKMVYRVNDSTTTTATSTITNGFICNTRTVSTTKETTLKSVNESAAIASNIDPAAQAMRLFAFATIGEACNQRTCSMGLGLTTAQRATYKGILDSYNDALGRAVP